MKKLITLLSLTVKREDGRWERVKSRETKGGGLNINHSNFCEIFVHNPVFQESLPPNIYLFKVINRNAKKICKLCLKLTIITPEPR